MQRNTNKILSHVILKRSRHRFTYTLPRAIWGTLPPAPSLQRRSTSTKQRPARANLCSSSIFDFRPYTLFRERTLLVWLYLWSHIARHAGDETSLHILPRSEVYLHTYGSIYKSQGFSNYLLYKKKSHMVYIFIYLCRKNYFLLIFTQLFPLKEH